MKYRARQYGFSLLEATVIIVILGIISAVAGITYFASDVNLDVQAQKIASDIRYIQFLAMTTNNRYRINFFPDQYSLTESDGVTAVTHPASMDHIFKLDGDIMLSTNLPNDYLVFDSIGVPYNEGSALGAPAQITLTLDGNNAMIEVHPETGKVSIQ